MNQSGSVALSTEATLGLPARADDDVLLGTKKGVRRLFSMTILDGTPTHEVDVGVYENVAAPFCMPLHCTAFDCNGEGARTP